VFAENIFKSFSFPGIEREFFVLSFFGWNMCSAVFSTFLCLLREDLMDELFRITIRYGGVFYVSEFFSKFCFTHRYVEYPANKGMEGRVFVAAVVEVGVVDVVVGMSGFTVYAERDVVVTASEDFNV
jgi:hypothetical protein